MQNRLSWNNNSLKMSRLHGGSTNSLADFLPETRLPNVAKHNADNTANSMSDICVKELAHKSGNKSGYLNLKKGSGFKSYKKYWCLIDQAEAYFYICSKDTKKVKHMVHLGGYSATKDCSADKKRNDKQFELIPVLNKRDKYLVPDHTKTTLSIKKSDGSNSPKTSTQTSTTKPLMFVTNTSWEADDWVRSFEIAIDKLSQSECSSLDGDVTDSRQSSTEIAPENSFKPLQSTPIVLIDDASNTQKAHESSLIDGEIIRKNKQGPSDRPRSEHLDDTATDLVQRRDSWHGRGGAKTRINSIKFHSQQYSNNDNLSKQLLKTNANELYHLYPESATYKTGHGSR